MILTMVFLINPYDKQLTSSQKSGHHKQKNGRYEKLALID